jgi:hypothetical protein
VAAGRFRSGRQLTLVTGFASGETAGQEEEYRDADDHDRPTEEERGREAS